MIDIGARSLKWTSPISPSFPAFVTVSDPCRPLKIVGLHDSMSLVSAGAQVIIDPVAPVSNMASIEVGWIEVVVPSRLI